MALRFSTHPGCWERHLQRQYDNPLFAHKEESVTQEAIQIAQQKDREDSMAFQKAFYGLVQEIFNLESRVEATIILNIKDKIDALYEQCAGLGGNFNAEKKNLRELSQLTMQSLMNGNTDDADIMGRFEKENIARELHFSLLEYPLIAHLLRPHSPIAKEDIVPTLLTEEESAIQAAMSLFSTEQQQILCQEARNLLSCLKREGYTLSSAWARLAVMEQMLFRPH
jgi:hypothetical protein